MHKNLEITIHMLSANLDEKKNNEKAENIHLTMELNF